MNGKIGTKDVCDPLETGGREVREGEPQQLLCYRADCGGLRIRLEERGHRPCSGGSLPASLAGVVGQDSSLSGLLCLLRSLFRFIAHFEDKIPGA